MDTALAEHAEDAVADQNPVSDVFEDAEDVLDPTEDGI